MSSPQSVLRRYLSAGQLIARRYQLEGVLGEGAYGAIYRAIDLISHDVVAIKALPPPQESTSQTAQGRFRREMEIIHNLVHPHIVALYDYGETEQGVPFMVMEFIEGITLEQCVRQQPMDFEDGVEVLRQLTSALGAAHAMGIVHRDLKPANIMVRGNPGRYDIKMLDFGMAKLLSQLGEATMSPLTREGMAVGTPRYIAPEQARGLEVGPYTDLYALGLLTYEIFTGERVVQKDDIEGAVMMHVSPQPLPMPLMGRVPSEVRPILRKLTEKKIKDRYQQAQQVLDDLDRLLMERRMIQRGPIPGQGGVPHAAAAGQSLDIDYERLAHAEQLEASARQAQVVNERSRQVAEVPSRSRIERAPGRPLRVLEWVMVPLMILAALTIFGAQLPIQDALLRFGVVCFPLLVGGLGGWLVQDRLPMCHVARALNLTALLLIVVAHLLGLGDLKTRLMLAPTWYLSAVKAVPGFSQLDAVITSLARHYVELLSYL